MTLFCVNLFQDKTHFSQKSQKSQSLNHYKDKDSSTSRTSDSSGRKIYGSALNHIVIT